MKHWWGKTLKWARTFHIYLSLAALVTLLYFATTGFVMNHEEWFTGGEPVVARETVTLPSEVRAGSDLAVVEYLRAHHGAVGEAKLDRPEGEITVQFRSPGRTLDARIVADTGETEITREWRGVFGVVSEMHRGKSTGQLWKLVMDATAVLVAVGVITGFIMWMGLRTRRRAGLLGLIASTGVVVTIFVLAVRGV